MRYCINCGTRLDNERFCVKCGTDNGEAVSGNAENIQENINSGALKKTDISILLHRGAVILFAISALILLVACCKSAQAVIASSLLNRFGMIFVVIYFVLGMWSVIPALLFCLDIKNQENGAVAGASIVLVAVMIIMAAIKAIADHFTEGLYFLNTVLDPLTGKPAVVIVLCVLAAAAGLIAMRKKQ